MRLISNIYKTILASLLLIFLLSLLSVVFGSIATGGLTLRYVFTVSFYSGTIIIVGGILLQMKPIWFSKKNKLIDHTTHAEYYAQKRELNRIKSLELITLGVVTILMTGVIQLILSFVIV